MQLLMISQKSEGIPSLSKARLRAIGVAFVQASNAADEGCRSTKLAAKTMLRQVVSKGGRSMAKSLRRSVRSEFRLGKFLGRVKRHSDSDIYDKLQTHCLPT